MGIFQRMSTVIRSWVNALIGKAEDPQKMLEQLVLDMRSQLAKTKQDVAAAIADEKKLLAQVEKEKQQADEWERRAMLAVQENRDDLAKQALMRHNEHVQHAQALHETWVKHKADTEALKDQLRVLNDKIEEAKRKKNILIARARRAEVQGRIQATMAGMSDQSAFESFERMAERIEDMERQAIAAAELAGELTGDTLARQFDQLEYRGSADQQLLDLKRKMGVLPAAPSAEARQLPTGKPGDQVAEAELVDEEDRKES
ncbi:MAG TPA: PspA/IM30 family protein [Gemmatimonadales bacterium]|nr:PspA/IM30 family protein [Gemmatimonadales bacterium]